MKKILLFLLLFKCTVGNAQETWIVVELNNEINDLIVEQAIPVVNENTGYLASFFKIKTGYVAYLYNENQHLEKTLKIDSDSKLLDVLVGSTYKGNEFTLFFTNNSGSKYSCLKIDFDNNHYSITEELGLEFKKEKLITYVENGSEFYALSMLKNSSILKLYDFNMEGKISSKDFDLSKEHFETDNELPLTLYSLMFGKHSDNNFETIDSSIPNALETTSAFTKVYLNDNAIQLTNNTFRKYTYLINLNLKNDSIQLSKIENKKFDKKNHNSNSNSYVLKNIIFNIYSNPDEIVFNVYNYKKDKVIKQFNIVSGDSISFKNSPIIHEIAENNFSRDLERTAQFIRKVNASNIGISAYPYKDNYIVTLGASEKIQSGEFAVIGGLLGGMVGAALFSTFDSYNRTKSTRIECMFDKAFNHVDGEIPYNGFDSINDFIKENSLKRAQLQTVFKYKEKYIWGSYNKIGRFYRFYQFQGF